MVIERGKFEKGVAVAGVVLGDFFPFLDLLIDLSLAVFLGEVESIELVEFGKVEKREKSDKGDKGDPDPETRRIEFEQERF